MTPNLKLLLDEHYPGWRDSLSWDGDNADFVVDCLLPLMDLSPEVRQVIQWAYGYDGEARSYEQWSDGSSIVKDQFFDGLAKDPHGVAHDYLHAMSHKGTATPDRRVWTFKMAADWYQKASVEFGDGRGWSFWKRFGLDLIAWPVWGPRPRRKAKFHKVHG